MFLRPAISHHLCFNEATKPFLFWACSFRQQHVLGSAQLSTENVKSFLDEEGLPEKKKIKNYYVPHPDVLARSEEEILKFRNENEIKIKGKGKESVPRPIFKLEETNFPSYIMDKFRAQNFTDPTPIQSQSWPIALQGDNMVGIARTGSGKTLAYLAPSIVRMKEEKQENPRARGPLTLVLAPTRELALQIQSVSHMFRDSINSVAVYGGTSRNVQASNLYEKPDIIIATPGRLLDFLRSQVVRLDQCSYIVLDEADRMLDMGFEPQIREIMDQTESEKQVLMWSATWPEEIQSLAEDYLQDYVHLIVGSEDLTANPNIKQILKFCTPFDRVFSLIEFLKSTGKEKSLIFTESKRMADDLKNILYKKGFRTSALHGDKSQLARETILRDFRDGRTQILIATEIAARGLDVNDIEFVINFELPKTIDSYIHRIGRTARHEKKGTAFSLITDEDKPIAKDLVNVLRKSNQEIPEQLLNLAKDSVRISFRNRYAPRDGSMRSGSSFSKKPFRRDDSYYARGNRYQSGRRNFDSEDSFDRGSYDRKSFDRGSGDSYRNRQQRRPKDDDDLW